MLYEGQSPPCPRKRKKYKSVNKNSDQIIRQLVATYLENNFASPIFGMNKRSSTKNASIDSTITTVRSEGLEHLSLKPQKLNSIFSSLLFGSLFVPGIIWRLCISLLSPLKA